jgi:ATP-dependent HslUV protease subunit HslV
LLDRDDMDAEQIAHKAMSIAAEICVYTNNNFVTEVIGGEKKEEQEEEDALEKAGKRA